MQEIVELRIAMARLKGVTINRRESSLTFQAIFLIKTSEEIVTDRLLVSDEEVRILDFGR